MLTSRAGTGASVHSLKVGNQVIADMFANPQAVFNNVRPLILGLDGNTGGFGQFRGLPYWNLNLGIKKNFRVTLGRRPPTAERIRKYKASRNSMT